ncbi:inositol monophosphatase family protein [Halopenitus persicus]|uniref:fructose-bisphosphatase n=1 Tax=Halopenitus persicus TaxID=1048396 RepID=A0A1H3KPS6_9EURY|nr:inositol monophosphatase [Halopenitus persicus]SDY53664.1 myo-inositol-1(or 4)-monophosphatase [Halopenitus persicus]
MTDTVDRVTVAERAARAGARVAHEHFRTGIAVETKGGTADVVTEADRAAQREVIDVVREDFPEDAVVGEEDDELKAVPDAGATWIVDPIDGTTNYVRNDPVWGTAVAAVVDGEPVAAAVALPALEDVYVAGETDAVRNDEPIAVSDVTDPEAALAAPAMWWPMDRREEYGNACAALLERFWDIRRIGSAQALLAGVAHGSIDGAITNVVPHPWDSVAGVHLIRQAGGTVTDLEGDRWRHDSTGLVASNGEIHDELLAAAAEID